MRCAEAMSFGAGPSFSVFADARELQTEEVEDLKHRKGGTVLEIGLFHSPATSFDENMMETCLKRVPQIRKGNATVMASQ